jgi:hypothetical protein
VSSPFTNSPTQIKNIPTRNLHPYIVACGNYDFDYDAYVHRSVTTEKYFSMSQHDLDAEQEIMLQVLFLIFIIFWIFKSYFIKKKNSILGI